MPRRRAALAGLACALCWCTASPARAGDTPPRSVLIDFDDPRCLERIQASDASLRLDGPESDRLLEMMTGHAVDWPGITMTPGSGFWDGSRYQHLSLDVINTGGAPCEIGLRIDNPGGDGATNRPVLIGEFHFGAPDRGLFHPSKYRPASSST